MAGVPITVLLCNSLFLCSVNVGVEGSLTSSLPILDIYLVYIRLFLCCNHSEKYALHAKLDFLHLKHEIKDVRDVEEAQQTDVLTTNSVMHL